MTKSFFIRCAIITSTLLLTGQGCALFGGNTTANGPDGGVFFSADKGVTWGQRVAIPTSSGKPNSIATLSVRTLTLDPSDHLAWYAGTQDNGLIYSYDQGQSWQQPKDVAGGAVYAVSVDSRNKCVVYAAINKTIMKTEDCNRTYKPVYTESRDEYYMTAIAIDPKNSQIVYVGGTSGDVLKSVDGGKNWAVTKRFGDEVRQINVHSDDSNQVYVGLANKGLQKSADGGATWLNITPDMAKYEGASKFRAMVYAPASGNSFILANGYGLFRTTNGGDSWEALKLVTAPGEIKIYGLAVNPKNSNEILYTSATTQSSTIFSSKDGGKTWSSKKAPTRRVFLKLIIDPEKPDSYIAAAFALTQ